MRCGICYEWGWPVLYSDGTTHLVTCQDCSDAIELGKLDHPLGIWQGVTGD